MDVLHHAKHEINSLRRTNEILQAKVEVLNIFKLALQPNGNTAEPMMADVNWRIDQAINKLTKEEQAKPEELKTK